MGCNEASFEISIFGQNPEMKSFHDLTEVPISDCKSQKINSVLIGDSIFFR